MILQKPNVVEVVLDIQDSIKPYALGQEAGFSIPTDLPADIFRAYDIRGVVDEALTADVVYAVGLALGTEARLKQVTTVAMGRDGRQSSPGFAKAMAAGLRDSGCDVIDIGMVPSPVLYFATHHLPTNTGIMITGSHNPKNYNGLKIVLDGQTLSTGGIQNLYQRIMSKDFQFGRGEYKEQPVVQAYLHAILDRISLARPLSVVVDCGNGAGGIVAPQLFKSLGCELTLLYEDVDGDFPNHHPDPTIPKNLVDLQNKVKEVGADIGIAFDGDADRLGVVLPSGKIVWPDRQVMLFAKELLEREPGSKIVYDVKCSANLAKFIRKYQGEPIMWRTGHSVLKAKMVAEQSPFAGEMSGHLFFKDGWFGFDDGVYSAARMLSILAADDRDPEQVFANIPDAVATPEIKVDMPEDKKADFLAALAKQDFADAEVVTIDGLRIEYADGWGLVRASNTTPCLTLRFEANDEAGLQRIQAHIREAMLAVDASLQLNF